MTANIFKIFLSHYLLGIVIHQDVHSHFFIFLMFCDPKIWLNYIMLSLFNNKWKGKYGAYLTWRGYLHRREHGNVFVERCRWERGFHPAVRIALWTGFVLVSQLKVGKHWWDLAGIRSRSESLQMMSRVEVTQRQLWGPMITQAEVAKRLWRDTSKNLLTHNQSCRHFAKDRGRAPTPFRTFPKNEYSSHLYDRLLWGYRKGITTNVSEYAGIWKDSKIFLRSSRTQLQRKT